MHEHESQWEAEFERWVQPFLAQFGHKGQRRWAPVYLRGLIAPGERKSVEPMARRQCPGNKEQLHHFVATSSWDTCDHERVLLEQADALVGGRDAHLIVDDTALVKKGTHSVGVAPASLQFRGFERVDTAPKDRAEEIEARQARTQHAHAVTD